MVDTEVEIKNGLKKKILKEGNAGVFPKVGDTVHVHYCGRFENGKIFDQTEGKDTFSFQLGTGQVISGWDEGVKTMTLGEKSTLTCPYQFAYGEKGYPGVIPPKSTLIFDVELVKIGK